MKRIKLILLFSLIGVSTAFSQSGNNPETKSVVIFQNVKTESIDVGGTDFFYRKLGENTSGIPIIFLNHLSATMDECDPRIMDSSASFHQVLCFDNREVGATGGTSIEKE